MFFIFLHTFKWIFAKIWLHMLIKRRYFRVPQFGQINREVISKIGLVFPWSTILKRRDTKIALLDSFFIFDYLAHVILFKLLLNQLLISHIIELVSLAEVYHMLFVFFRKKGSTKLLENIKALKFKIATEVAPNTKVGIIFIYFLFGK